VKFKEGREHREALVAEGRHRTEDARATNVIEILEEDRQRGDRVQGGTVDAMAQPKDSLVKALPGVEQRGGFGNKLPKRNERTSTASPRSRGTLDDDADE